MPEAISASEGTLVMSAVVRRRDPALSRCGCAGDKIARN
jgi:hypothetical protein